MDYSNGRGRRARVFRVMMDRNESLSEDTADSDILFRVDRSALVLWNMARIRTSISFYHFKTQFQDPRWSYFRTKALPCNRHTSELDDHS